MPRLLLSTVATSAPMGAETYQAQVSQRAADALQDEPQPWQVRRSITRSMRSPLAGDRRLPLGRLGSAPAAVRRAAGRSLHRRDTVVHRMNLELPPAPIDVVTLHDVVAWTYADESAPVRAAAEELRRAAAVICVSQSTAEQAIERLGLRDPHVVHNGVDPAFLDATPADRESLAELGITGQFVLTTGGASRRKNLAALAEAWPVVRASRPDLTLVLTGPPHPARSSLFAGLNAVVLAGMLPAHRMPGLVAAATAVVVPSLDEGFGFPAVEAMAAGTTVVAADRSSLPEVVGDGGLLVAADGAGLSEGILTATSGDPALADLRRLGRTRADQFSWERSLQGHARVWSSVV